jgi:hypothetical protein
MRSGGTSCARYASVHRRCAPRSKWRTHELADLLRADEGVTGAMQERLARWMAEVPSTKRGGR